jgi:hypothetical protein
VPELTFCGHEDHSREISHKSDVHGVQLNLVHEEMSGQPLKAHKNVPFYKPRPKPGHRPLLRRPDLNSSWQQKDPDFGPVIRYG